MQNEKSRRTPPVDHQVDKTESKLKLLTESMKENSYSYSVPKGAKEKEGMAQGATATTKPGLDDKRGIDPTHGASTRTSLDHTITVSLCSITSGAVLVLSNPAVPEHVVLSVFLFICCLYT